MQYSTPRYISHQPTHNPDDIHESAERSTLVLRDLQADKTRQALTAAVALGGARTAAYIHPRLSRSRTNGSRVRPLSTVSGHAARLDTSLSPRITRQFTLCRRCSKGKTARTTGGLREVVLTNFFVPGLLAVQSSFTFTTASSQKKRKLAPFSHVSDTSGILPDAPSARLFDEIGLQAHARSSPSSSPQPHSLSTTSEAASQPSSPASSNTTRNTPPPRFVPPHLQDEVLQSREFPGRTGQSGGASPSGALAGITIDNDSGANMSGSENDGTNGDRRAMRTSNRTLGARSASPAKRTAADMESSSHSHPDTVPGSFEDTSRDGPTDFDQVMSGMTPAPNNADALGTLPDGTDVTGSKETNASSPRKDLPSIDDQVRQVTELAQQPIDEGQRGYLVSNRWLARVQSRASINIKNNSFSKEAREGPIGPVDNSDIVPDGAFPQYPLYDLQDRMFVPLKPGVVMTEDFQVLPENAWGLILDWYGLAQGQRQIERYAHNTTDVPGQNIIYELFPPVVTIRKVPQSDAAKLPPSNISSIDQYRKKEEQRKRGQTSPEDAIQFVTSRTERFQKFLRRSKEAAGIPVTTKIQMFRILNPENTPVKQSEGLDLSMPSPPQSRPASPVSAATATNSKLVLNSAEFQKLELGKDIERLDASDETNNEKYNGSSTLGVYGITESQTILLEEQIGGPAGGEFASDKKKLSSKLMNKHGSKPASTTTSGRTSPAPGSIMTRGRTRRDGRTRGTVGLINLGNTCYMNSALQCIRSVEELAVYFLSEQYKREINSSNPLGYNGVMAKQYANVLQGIYSETATGAFSPSAFKKALGNAQPLFSGYGQQDSQEFLSFLVDALHEDLNRIEKKPYNENPDSDDQTVGNPQAIVALGEVYRKNHKARNDSVAMDLFSGFYKNTMECPHCEKISITFDPYSLLTVQLPIENTFRHTITLVPLGGRSVNVLIDVDKNASVKTVKQQIASKYQNLTADRLWMIEVYSHKVYRVFEDQLALSEANIQQNDFIFVYELPDVPSNLPEPPKRRAFYSYSMNRNDEEIPEMDSAKADRFAVPVFSRQKGRYANSWEMILHPLYIMLTRDEAQDYDIILKKVLVAVASLTSRPILADFDESSDADLVTLNGEGDKAQASEDEARVSDHSVPSDDGYVQVSLNGARDSRKPANFDDTEDTSVRIPASFMDPTHYITPALRNHLFALNFAKSNEGPYCASMSSIESKAFNMLDRVRRNPRRESNASASSQDSIMSTGSAQINGDAEESDVDDDDASKADTETVGEDDSLSTVTVDEDNDEMSGPPIVSDAGLANPRSGRRRKNGKSNRFGGKRGKKGKKHGKRGRQVRQQNRLDNGASDRDMPPPLEAEDENPYYIKLGEGIVLDWYPEGCDALFGAGDDAKEPLRGRYLSSDDGQGLAYIDDPILKAKEQKRAERKKNGVTLEDCFVETGKREILSEDNAWYCNRCKEMRQAAKTLEIWTIPEILIVHLKRFGGNRSFRDKIDVFVDYPIDGLDLTDRIGLKEDGKEYIYDLFAVDNHYGGLGGGHYTAYAKNFCDGLWYDYNDSSCSKVSDAKVHSPAAYLLFYRRRSEKPLGPQYLQNLVNEFRNPAPSEQLDDESEAGEGRLGGPISSLRGSPSASAGAAAAAENHRNRDGGVGAGVDSSLIRNRTMTSELGTLHGQPLYGPVRPPTQEYGNQGSTNWSFDDLGDSAMRVETGDDNADALSTAAERDSPYASASGDELMDLESVEGFASRSSPGYDDDPTTDRTYYSATHEEYTDDTAATRNSSPPAQDIVLDEPTEDADSKLD